MAFPLDETLDVGDAGHVEAHEDIHALLNNNTNVQSGTTYTLVLGDAGKTVECTSASAVSLTVPPNSSVAFPTGTVVSVTQMGAGAVTLVQGSGVTIRTPASLQLAAQYATAVIRKRATDEWVAGGGLL